MMTLVLFAVPPPPAVDRHLLTFLPLYHSPAPLRYHDCSAPPLQVHWMASVPLAVLPLFASERHLPLLRLMSSPVE
jgi:hypothetical protein